MDLSSLGKKLGDLLAQLRIEDTEEGWLSVEAIARSLANGLRTKDGPGAQYCAESVLTLKSGS